MGIFKDNHTIPQKPIDRFRFASRSFSGTMIAFQAAVPRPGSLFRLDGSPVIFLFGGAFRADDLTGNRKVFSRPPGHRLLVDVYPEIRRQYDPARVPSGWVYRAEAQAARRPFNRQSPDFCTFHHGPRCGPPRPRSAGG